MVKPASRTTWNLILLVGAVTLLWSFANRVGPNRGLMAHWRPDQYSRQAEGWLNGSLSIEGDVGSQELVRFEGRIYNSFPPTPALFELPLVAVYGRATPNHFVMFIMLLIPAIVMFRMGIVAGLSSGYASLLALGFTCGTNSFVSTLQGGVWSQAQVCGFCLAVCSLGCFIGVQRPSSALRCVGYLLMSLAVGCRPFYVAYFPLLIALDANRGGGTVVKSFCRAALAASPYLALLALHNYVRFDNPLEFGHRLLPHEESLKYGSFSPAYIPRNMRYMLLKLPELNQHGFFVNFAKIGNAVWINNPLFLIGVLCFWRNRLDRSVVRAMAAAVSLTLVGFLMHQNTGYSQFGSRYFIDLLPVAFLGLIYGGRQLRWSSGVVAYSVVINVYGVWWYFNSGQWIPPYFIRKGSDLTEWQVNEIDPVVFFTWTTGVAIAGVIAAIWYRCSRDEEPARTDPPLHDESSI
jgi:hypothetical protein